EVGRSSLATTHKLREISENGRNRPSFGWLCVAWFVSIRVRFDAEQPLTKLILILKGSKHCKNVLHSLFWYELLQISFKSLTDSEGPGVRPCLRHNHVKLSFFLRPKSISVHGAWLLYPARVKLLGGSKLWWSTALFTITKNGRKYSTEANEIDQ